MKDKIVCPNCNYRFDVESALSNQLEEEYKSKYAEKIAEHSAALNNEKKALEQEWDKLEKYKNKERRIFQKKLDDEMIKKAEDLRKEMIENYEQKLKSLEIENEKKKEENRQLRATEIELLKKQNELNQKEEDLNLFIEKQILERQKEIENNARSKEREILLMKEKELLKKLDDQNKMISELQRKAEQGSVQLQGEVQELAIEELLRTVYPFDQIDEVPKGFKGADCIQTVINSRQQSCGLIVYESKRTKHFSNDWIDKLKDDQLMCKAEIAVLVTETFPKGMTRFGEKNGIWICGFHELKSLSMVLRQLIIKTHSAKLTQVNRGEKMELLYNYLTSNEFVQNVNRIVENYDTMIQQLNKEKISTQRLWAAREKQIWAVQENLSNLFGSIKGIAGQELDTQFSLDLPE